MPSNDAFQFARQALWLVLTLSAPPIIVATLIGLIVAIVQAATQIQEQTVQYAAKFFSIVLTIFLTASLLGNALVEFTNRVLEEFPFLFRR
jgi:type III secretion protein S